MRKIPLTKQLGFKQALQNTIIVLILILTLVSITTGAIQKALLSKNFDQLHSVLVLKKLQVIDYLQEKQKNIKTASINPDINEYVLELIQYHNEMGIGTDEGFDISSSGSQVTQPYSKIEEKIYAALQPYSRIYDINDIYLICSRHGHVMFSLKKRDDFPSNIAQGRYKDSVINRLWKTVVSTKQIQFADIDLYAPANNEPVLLVGAPVFNGEELLAVMVFDLPIQKITNILQEKSGMGSTGESYLVGQDFRMRTSSLLDPIQHSLKASFNGPIEKNGAKTEAAGKALQGEENEGSATDYRDIKVFAAWSPLIENTLNWGIVSKIDQSEVLTPLHGIYRTMTILGLISFIIVTILSLLQVKGLTNPLNDLIEASTEIAQGNLSFTVKDMKRQDELGLLHSQFKDMIDSLTAKEEVIHAIAQGSGDFTVKVKLSSQNDSFGQNLQNMLSNLNQVLQKVRKASLQVSEEADQVSNASQSLSQGSTEQASALEQISASLTSIEGQSKQNAENSGEANALVKQALIQASDGNSLMSELKKAMDEINRSSDQIGRIVKVIDDIAFQINLLALNANVEAARAGKYGKGFGVVAEEVRNLAAKSADAVKETTAMIKGTQSNIKSGSQIAQQTAEQLNNIFEGVDKVADIIEEISMASKEQAQNIAEISTGLSQIDTVTQGNTASAEESAAAAQELASQSQFVMNLISQFKLIGDNPSNQTSFDLSQKEDHKEDIKRQALPPIEPKRKEETGIRPLNPEDIISLDDEDFETF
ncbi:methyl-accepting chemotaxis protein [Spirochaeta cellobiosiphila]|uniref:methyl-accepting chemotaxis protein n=1 Tax=Spirochaeta cellobiosiphila TaxID=504483 RepID=UPI000422C7F7|nr:methyl-accepting chemotaxis protein [Spirochaeta cellobiosiphila]